jgi:hypothetical protein
VCLHSTERDIFQISGSLFAFLDFDAVRIYDILTNVLLFELTSAIYPVYAAYNEETGELAVLIRSKTIQLYQISDHILHSDIFRRVLYHSRSLLCDLTLHLAKC